VSSSEELLEPSQYGADEQPLFSRKDTTMTPEPIMQYDYLGTHVTVFGNRLEIKYAGGIFGKKEMIVFRNITSIEIPPIAELH